MMYCLKRFSKISVMLMACSVLIAWIGPGQNSPITTGTLGHFPQMHGMSLQGHDWVVPKAFDNKLNLVVVNFAHKHRSKTDIWVSHYKETLAQRHPDLGFFAIALLNRRTESTRFSINNSVRNTVRGSKAREHTILVYTDRKAFLEHMDMDANNIYPMLVDQNGRIIWRGIGAAHSENKIALNAAIGSLTESL